MLNVSHNVKSSRIEIIECVKTSVILKINAYDQNGIFHFWQL